MVEKYDFELDFQVRDYECDLAGIDTIINAINKLIAQRSV